MWRMQQALQQVAELLTEAADKQAELLGTLDTELRRVHEQLSGATASLRELLDNNDAVPADVSQKVLATASDLDTTATQLLILVHPQPPEF